MKFRKPAEAASTGLITVGLSYTAMSGVFVFSGQPWAKVKDFAITGVIAAITGSIVLILRKTVGSNYAKRGRKAK